MKRLLLIFSLFLMFVIVSNAAVDTTYLKVGTNVVIRGNWFESSIALLGTGTKFLALQMDDSLLVKYTLNCGFRYSNVGDTNKIFWVQPYNPYPIVTTGQILDTARIKSTYVNLEIDSATWNALDTKFVFTNKAESGKLFIYEIPPKAIRFVICPLVLTTVSNSTIKMNVYRYKW